MYVSSTIATTNCGHCKKGSKLDMARPRKGGRDGGEEKWGGYKLQHKSVHMVSLRML